MTTTTDNMALILAVVSQTLGPEWAERLNAAFERIDLHDHSEGNGAQVTTAGILIDDDLSFEGNKATNVNGAGLRNQNATDTDFEGSIQRVGEDLYWINGAGAAVQLTSGGSVVSSGSGAVSLASPGAYPYAVTSADAQKVLAIDTSAARTLTLPAATTTMFFMVKDAAGSAATNNITITPDGTDLIDGANADYLVSADWESIGLVSDGVSKWYVV